MCILIAAVDEGGVIGSEGGLPWNLPGDLAHFRQLTMGGTLIMGRVTWESLPDGRRFLDGRANYVVTRYQDLLAGEYSPVDVEGPHFVHSIESAISAARRDCPEYSGNFFIIGGGQIFQHAIDRGLVERMVISHVEGSHEGDVFFPGIPDGWPATHVLDGEGFKVVMYSRPDK